MTSYNKRGGTTSPPLDMDIQIWYNKEVSQWRWTLTSDTYTSIMESGNSEELREAMDDVATTVEWLLDTELTE